MGWDQVRPEGFTLLEFSLFGIWSRECPSTRPLPTLFTGAQILCPSQSQFSAPPLSASAANYISNKITKSPPCNVWD